MVLPFSLFFRSDRNTYYVAFKNEVTGRYLNAISTKKQTEKEALRIAWEWFRTGIPQKGIALDLKTCSLRDSIHRSEISKSDAEYIINELKQRGLVLSCIFAGDPGSVRFADLLSEFWDWERSLYTREKLRAEHSIHKNYVDQIVFFPANQEIQGDPKGISDSNGGLQIRYPFIMQPAPKHVYWHTNMSRELNLVDIIRSNESLDPFSERYGIHGYNIQKLSGKSACFSNF